MSGLLLHPPQRIIQQLLIDLGGLVTNPDDDDDWPCFYGSLPDVPDGAIVVADTTGKVEGREMVAGYLFEKHGIQIKVRSAGPVDGYVKSARILQSLTAVHNVETTVLDEAGTSSSDYRVQSLTPTSPVIKLGPETPQSHRYVWTANYIVSVRML